MLNRGIGRREFLRWATALPALAVMSAAPPAAPSALAHLGVRPRADWAGDLAPTGSLPPEDDVRFLLVHHSVSRNDYAAADVPSMIRSFYSAHTGRTER